MASALRFGAMAVMEAAIGAAGTALAAVAARLIPNDAGQQLRGRIGANLGIRKQLDDSDMSDAAEIVAQTVRVQVYVLHKVEMKKLSRQWEFGTLAAAFLVAATIAIIGWGVWSLGDLWRILGGAIFVFAAVMLVAGLAAARTARHPLDDDDEEGEK